MNALILDTHVLLWWMLGSRKLSPKARSAIRNQDTAILVSSASIWEIAIKTRKGTLQGCGDYLASFRQWHERWGFSTLDIAPEHAALAGALPIPLSDPFDRMLIAQSQLTGAALVTSDKSIHGAHASCWW